MDDVAVNELYLKVYKIMCVCRLSRNLSLALMLNRFNVSDELRG